MNSLASLSAEYENWRKTKGWRNQAIPEELRRKTCQAAKEFGFSAVQRALKVTPKQLEKLSPGRQESKGGGSQAPTLSCTVVDLPIPQSSNIELLMPDGLLLRCHDVSTCLALVEALQAKATRGWGHA